MTSSCQTNVPVLCRPMRTMSAATAGVAATTSQSAMRVLTITCTSRQIRSPLLATASQVLLFDREDRSRLDLNVRDGAGSAALVGKLDIIHARRRVGDLQSFVVVDGVVAIVVGLLPSPLVLAGRRKLQRCDCVRGQVPELGVVCPRAFWRECENERNQNRRPGHFASLPDFALRSNARDRDHCGNQKPAHLISACANVNPGYRRKRWGRS